MALRDDLAALQIDRDGGRSGGRVERPRVKALLLLGIGLLIGAGAGYGVALQRPAATPPRVAASRATLAGQPGTQPAAPELVASGYIVTRSRYIALGVRVPGRIEAYLVEEGDPVEPGSPLVRLDASPYEVRRTRVLAALDLATANRDLARKELQRLRALRSQNVAAPADIDVKETELRVAEAEIEKLRADLRLAELDLEDTVLRSPAAGVVLEKFKEVGEMATPGGFAGSGELIRIANLDELRIQVEVSETDLDRVQLDQRVEIVPDADPSRRYAGVVVELAPQMNRQKGTLQVEARLAAPDAFLRPDMSARVRFRNGTRPPNAAATQPSVLAPRDAVRDDRGETYSWVVVDGRLHRRRIATAGERAGRVLVSEGLMGGEILVVGDTAGLREGLRVIPTFD